MVSIVANMTQVLTQSPQVTAIVASEAATAEQIKHSNQIEESRRFREQLKSTVVSTEPSVTLGESEEETRRRLEERNRRPAVEEERGRRRGRSRTAARAAEKRADDSSSSGGALPFESRQVIDVCV